jgi:putative ABC transport system permease protein
MTQRFLSFMLSDLRYAFRQLTKSPGFTAIVGATIALAIGACTVIFTAIDATLLHPVGGPNADRSFLIHETRLPQVPQMQVSPPTFLDLERQATSFEFVSSWRSFTTNLTGAGEPTRLTGAYVTLHQFEAWGTDMALGRPFTADEYTPGRNNVAVISFALWQSVFGGEPGVIGRSVQLDGTAVTIVGITAADFARYGSESQMFEPLVFTANERSENWRGAHFLQMGGLLKPGVTIAQAQAELNVFAGRFAQQYPKTNRGSGFVIRLVSVYINRTLAPLLHLLLGAVGCVLLIACANVANLLLARASTRQREISLRAALGAVRGQLIRQLLIESVLLALLGGVGGIFLANLGLSFIRTFAPAASTDLGRLAYARLDSSMLAFTLVFSAAVGVLFGLAPAWMASKVELSQALKQSGRGSSGGAASGRMRSILIIVEVALALVLLGAAGLLVRSFRETARVDPGFAPDHAVAASIALRPQKYGSRADLQIGFAGALLPRLRALPGVEGVALTTITPFNDAGLWPFSIEGRPVASPADQPAAEPYVVTADYFRAMGVPVRRGRVFTDHDNAKQPLVVIISTTFASQFFPNQEPLGQRINLAPPGNPPVWCEIVGVVGDVMEALPGAPVYPQLYCSWLQQTAGNFFVIVRTRGDPAAILSSIKPQVYAVDRDQPIATVRTLQDWMDTALAKQRLTLRLLSAFAVIALLIALVGIYGVMAYDVNQRTMEFGIRMALGANSGHVLRQVLRRGMRVVAIGTGIGLCLSLALGRIFASLLYHTSPYDPLTLAGVVGLLLAIAFVACLIPARRATRVDPLVALRAE